MNYAVYHKLTGEIIRTGKCPAGLLQKQLGKNPQPNHAVKECAEGVNDVEHAVRAGEISKRPAAQIAERKRALRSPGTLSASTLRSIFAHLKKQGIDLGPAGAEL